MHRPAPLRRVVLVAAVLLLASACPPRSPSTLDPDRDGLDPAWEAVWGSDPLRADSDADGVPDGIEVLHWTDATDPLQHPRNFPIEPYSRAGIFYAASHDASGSWTLTAWDAGLGNEPFALLGRPNGGAPFGLAFDHHGLLYVTRGFELARVHPFTGAVDGVVPLHDAAGAAVLVLEIAFDPLTLELYGIERRAEEGFAPGTQLVRIDRRTGLVTGSGVALPAAVHALAFRHPDPGQHPPRSPVLVAALDMGAGEDRVVELALDDPLAVFELSQVPWPVSGMAIDPFDPRGHPAVAVATGPASSDILWGSVWGWGYPRVLGAFSGPPPCPAPCYGAPSPLMLPPDVATGRLADRDGDGAVDAVVLVAETPWVPRRLEVWRNDGTGVLSLASTSPVAPSNQPWYFAGFALADFVGDTALDAAVLDPQGVAILPATAGGGFDAEALLLPGEEYSLAAGDVTGDGRADVVVSGRVGLRVHQSNGAGGFAEPVDVDGSFHPERLALASRGPGADAIVATDHAELVAYEPDGSGGFTRSAPFAEIDPYWGWNNLVAGDLDGDGIDEVVATSVASAVDVFRRNAGGSWDRQQTLPLPLDFVPASFSAPVIGDTTGDGHADVLVPIGYDGFLVLVGDGSGTLVWSLAPLETTGLWGEGAFALGDIDGNGIDDPVRFDPYNDSPWLPSRTPFPQPD